MKLADMVKGMAVARKHDRRSRRPRAMEMLETRNLLSTFVVTTASDAGSGSLRDAITKANDNPGYDVIAFAIPGTGVKTINLKTELPEVCDRVLIDGLSQPGALTKATPQIAINGRGMYGDGLEISAGSSTVTGLSIYNFRYGNMIRLEDNGWNTIQDCFLGVKPNGKTPGEMNDGSNGILIDNVGNNLIGGTTGIGAQFGGNVISGNGDDGIDIKGRCADYNIIIGNYIGTANNGNDVDGDDIGNDDDGIYIHDGASNVTIGGMTLAERNIISNNGGDGIDIEGDYTRPYYYDSDDDDGDKDFLCFDITIQGNYIGVNKTGNQWLGNADNGIESSADDILIGGVRPGAGNVISANGGNGIAIDGERNVVQGNKIGTDKLGLYDLGNVENGVEINDDCNVVGGTIKAAGNVIAFNQEYGVFVDEHARNNTIRFNSIFQNYEGIELDEGEGNCGIPAPTLNYALLAANHKTVTVTGVIQLPGSPLYNLQAQTPVMIDIYATDELDNSSQTAMTAQGKIYLGTVPVVTDIFGNATFKGKFTAPLGISEWYLTATATLVAPPLVGSTSEFSAPIQV